VSKHLKEGKIKKNKKLCEGGRWEVYIIKNTMGVA
jgi:hypothetical protein